MPFPNILAAMHGHGRLPLTRSRQGSISISLARAFCFFDIPKSGVAREKIPDGNA